VSTVEWRKSGRSGSGSNDACVEIAFLSVGVGVRDSKNPSDRLRFTRRAWEVFAREAR
jgi:hypothetical protein